MRESRFKNSFIFKYSARPGTKAAELFADDVPEEVKRRRNNELLAMQNEISLEDNQRVARPPRGGARRRAEQGGEEEEGRRGRGEGRRGDGETRRRGDAETTETGRGAGGDAETRRRGDAETQLVGRTICDRIVVFDGPLSWAGQFKEVAIERADAFTLFGRPADVRRPARLVQLA